MSEMQFGSWMYKQIQLNGQRITTNVSFQYSLMADINPTELFVNGIPYFMYEDSIIPLFETIGVVAQFRLMMAHSGRNRGYGYLIFVDANDAHRAIDNLNGVLLSSLCRLQLSISSNRRHLWLGNVADELDVNTVIHMCVEKVDPETISIRNRTTGPCLILEFKTNREAALALRVMVREVRDFGRQARTYWLVED